MAPKEGRDRTGRFLPGSVGNPQGRPKLTPSERNALLRLRQASPRAATQLIKIMDDETADPKLRAWCADRILTKVGIDAPARQAMELTAGAADDAAERLESGVLRAIALGQARVVPANDAEVVDGEVVALPSGDGTGPSDPSDR